MSRTGTAQSSAGAFASARRGTAMEDVARLIAPPISRDTTADPWPFRAASEDVKQVIRAKCAKAGITLDDLHSNSDRSLAPLRATVFAEIKNALPSLSFEAMAEILRRDKSNLQRIVSYHNIARRRA